MKSIILCEGRTDFLFLQYFMKDVFKWNDSEKHYPYKGFLDGNRVLNKAEDELVIGFSGGCSKIPNALEKIITLNKNSGLADKKYDRIVIVSDQDDADFKEKIIESIEKIISDFTGLDYQIKCDEWIDIHFTDVLEQSFSIKLLVLLIPPNQNGALETFVLESIAKNDRYDKNIIDQGNSFVDRIDPEFRYLKKRRDFLKAKFNVYVGIYMPEVDFVHLHDIFKKINWNEQSFIIQTFYKLRELDS